MATEELSNVGSPLGMMAEAPLAPDPPLPARSRRALTFGLLLSALRCTAQYVVLPFVLPWIGVTTTIPPWVTLGLGALALGSLARNVRYLWRLHHPRRWSYIVIAVIVAAALLVFTVVDLHALLHS
ncbi:MAG TPA: hypothetical protein VF221_01960 [Chloroflexota bacterium]